MGGGLRLTIIEPIADLGTVVSFRGTDDAGDPWVVCADHRPARDIVAALAEGEEVVVEADEWNAWRTPN
jgi:hypothetical protein